ncbi:MAG TPA: hypothetical protein VFF09_02555, partial [archaeon]|nr:hypothetical protein [archaeon]
MGLMKRTVNRFRKKMVQQKNEDSEKIARIAKSFFLGGPGEGLAKPFGKHTSFYSAKVSYKNARKNLERVQSLRRALIALTPGGL